ncbi:hypothetical protein LEP1GSC185_2610 [Leptospira licerasiae serovar Varillal str. VAR 010]|uniref:Uncharacterized protein n=1 Tax=Leptospira licerasiae str. MMD4847 TaxID=1049971 RepID=A0ABP2RC80_9LEPT|nr:hypothetical protein LEP1GSC185_2610 [Leptospira licerasiae serovar Varillal str. VAR 010]EJZ42135.1 hypothetical protein LEP1GSC178_0385 [Leptospira licerasiae str. MMD4847]
MTLVGDSTITKTDIGDRTGNPALPYFSNVVLTLQSNIRSDK